MPSYKSAFGEYLKTEDLQGRPATVSITHVDLVTIEGRDGKPDERKLAAHFAGKDKVLILNKTRCEQLASIFGTDNYEEWIGAAVLVPGTTKFGGKDVPCVNITAKLSAATAAKPKPEPPPEPEELDSDTIPFAWLLPLVLPALAAIGSVAV